VTTAKTPGERSRFHGVYRLLLVLAALALVVVFIFPLIFSPGVEAPADVRFGSPSALQVQISNQNLMPLKDVEFSCEVSRLELAQGSQASNPQALVRGSIKKLEGRRAITAPCETAYLVTSPVKAVEYKLTITYRVYPWPYRRTKVSHIAARISGSGQVTGWKVD
jgi:hypothetical protein